jgi:hypothetical protein
MSGVVDAKGQQWEHCNAHAKPALFKFPQDLGYEKPSVALPYGRMICVTCADQLIRARKVKFKQIVPAPSWQQVVVRT